MTGTEQNARQALDAIDRRIVAATAPGLPIEAEPYSRLASTLGIDETALMARLRAMMQRGVIRRIGVVPNHYALGYRANGMSVWDVDDDVVDVLGPKVGALPFVSHCYRRPRHPGVWPYNLFAMVHGRAQDEVEAKVARINALLGTACHGHDVLLSTRILKKSGLRLSAPERGETCSD